MSGATSSATEAAPTKEATSDYSDYSSSSDGDMAGMEGLSMLFQASTRRLRDRLPAAPDVPLAW
jgi:hypothetical protein